MNTSTITADIETTDTTAETVAPKRSFGRRIRAALASTLVGAALVSGAVVGISAPAQAATSYGTITGCFQSSYTLYNTTYWGKYTGTAYVDAWYNGKWNQVTTMGLNLTSGCGSISVQAGYQWRLRVNEYRKPYSYTGISNFTQAVVGGYTYNVGTTRLGGYYVG